MLLISNLLPLSCRHSVLRSSWHSGANTIGIMLPPREAPSRLSLNCHGQKEGNQNQNRNNQPQTCLQPGCAFVKIRSNANHGIAYPERSVTAGRWDIGEDARPGPTIFL